VPLKIQKTDDLGYFSGYASVFNIQDSHGDIIKPGAFQHSIEKLEKENRMPKMLWQHDHTLPIGLWTFIEEDHYGLYVEGKLLLDVQKSKEAYTLLKAKAVDGLSIGYSVEQAYKNQDGGRTITKINLHEISIVTFASNSQAFVQCVKKDDLL